MTLDEDLVLPVRNPTELREEVGRRVTRARRRRRVRRAGASAALGVVVALAFVGGPDGGVTLRTPAPDNVPASEGTEAGRDEENEEDAKVSSGHPPAETGTPGAAGEPSTGRALTPAAGPAPAGPAGAATGSAAEVDVRFAVVRMSDVWELKADGTPVRRLVEEALSPAWSPDGRRLAYTQRHDSVFPRSDAWVIDLATSERRRLSNSSDAGHPAFSPDGTLVAFERSPSSNATPPEVDPSVVVVDLDAPASSDRWTIRDAASPTWSPDGRLLHGCNTGLCISRADGSNRVQIPNSQKLSDAAWSPDGAWITATESYEGGLYVLRPDGSGRRKLLDRVGAGGAAWSPDGARFYYPTDNGIHSMRPDGSDVRVVTQGSVDQYVAVVRR